MITPKEALQLTEEYILKDFEKLIKESASIGRTFTQVSLNKESYLGVLPFCNEETLLKLELKGYKIKGPFKAISLENKHMKYSPRPGIFEDIICYRICWDEEQNNLKINILLKTLNEIAEGDCSYSEDSGCSKLNNGMCDSCLARKALKEYNGS